MTDVQIDLDAGNPVANIEPEIKAAETTVVFVPFADTNMRINKEEFFFPKGQPKKVTHDQARILMDAKKGYLKD